MCVRSFVYVCNVYNSPFVAYCFSLSPSSPLSLSCSLALLLSCSLALLLPYARLFPANRPLSFRI